MSRLIRKWGIPVVILVFVAYFFARSLDLETYQKHAETIIPEVQGVQEFLSDFSVKQSPVSEEWLLTMIDSAKERIHLAIYSFTLPNLREALVRARNRGVDVRIILEKSPFQATTINRETVQYFRENNISLYESRQFTFMHAKYLVIDNDWIVETANWTRSSFSKNREFFILGDDPSILGDLESIFQKDFTGGSGISTDIRLLAGPANATERLQSFLSETQDQLDVYAPDISDKNILESLGELCRSGKIVHVLVEYELREDVSYPECIEIRLVKKLNLHAKALIRDESDVFVGSFNFTTNSLNENREVGLFLTGDGVKNIKKTFHADWQQGEIALRRN